MGVSNLINTSESGTKVLATALLSSAHPALQTPPQGQEKMGATSNSEAHLQMLSEKLNLTEHQKAKLKPIL
jgi:Spy/CpxP family protein refolding chaperone